MKHMLPKVITAALLICMSPVFTTSCIKPVTEPVNTGAQGDVPTESGIPEDVFYTEGRFLMSKSDTPMIVTSSGPCTISTSISSLSLESLTDGDLIRVLSGPVLETYPGRMAIYSIEKLSDGEMSDIDPHIIASLTEMGWLEETQKTSNELLGVQYVRTDGYHEFFTYPRLVYVRSQSELEAYYEAFSDFYSLGRRTSVYSDSTAGWLDAADAYDDRYFDEYGLYMLILEEGSGSVRHTVKSIVDGVVTVEWHIPEVCTDDMAEWHIFIEVLKDETITGICGADGEMLECEIYTVNDAIDTLRTNTSVMME